jgi:cation:H+ antiporter
VDDSGEPTETVSDDYEQNQSIAKSSIFIIAGIAMLWIGSGWLVTGATGLAKTIGVSDLVIGLTVVAIGSSAPEIATSLIAATKGYPEMAIGNVVGSNIANLLLVGGVTACVSTGINVPQESLEFDIPVMVIACVACLPVFISGSVISRREGVVFLVCFAAFTAILFFRASLAETFPQWSYLVWVIAIPVTLVALVSYANHKKNSTNNI